MRQTPIAIVNPNSNGGQTGKNWDSIEVTLKKYFGDDIKTVFTKAAGDGTILARISLLYLAVVINKCLIE